MNSATPAGKDPTTTTARLERAAGELRKLEREIQAGDMDPRVLHDFREAMDHIRLTAWAAQEWIEQHELHKDTRGATSLLVAERVRRATQLTNDVSADLEKVSAEIPQARLEKLFVALERLYLRLAPMVKKGSG